MLNKGDETLARRLADLRGEHSDLDLAIKTLEDSGRGHELQIRRQLSRLVKEGRVNARQVYDQGWRFYYSRA